ncbi:MAG TPA: GTP 3',8-cyclase MoaA [bacterium]|nr:GTP 3',8-cyclase MoaA [bacterium]
MLTDGSQRKIEYLRLSLTDLCNIRCHYCLPPEGISKAHRSEILSFEEIERLVSLLAGLGIRRVRLTGGEPLVRQGLPELVRRLKAIGGLEEVLLTTNALLLAPIAKALREAGLTQINIHLDTLKPKRFRQITRLGEIERVFEGIEAARREGFSPIKLNAVVQRGINDGEVTDLLEYAARQGLTLRFIEMMPIGPGLGMPRLFIPRDEILERLSERFTLLPSTERLGLGPASYYRIQELGTLVGFIAPVSHPFCDACNRIRISSDGRFQDCLAYDGTFSFRDRLRTPGVSDDEIAGEVRDLLQGKRPGHAGFVQLPSLATPCMSAIGG